MAGERFCGQTALVEQVYHHVAGDWNTFRGLAQSSKFWENGSTITWWAESHPDARFVADGFELLDPIVGLTFERVNTRENADIRIGFDYSLGSFSYIGTDATFIGSNTNTMNFGWPLQNSFDTVIHEQIHALGGLHEHQSPDRSLVFNRDVVIADLAAQGWSEADVESNVFAVAFADVSTGYDIESVMHYSLPARWLSAPEPYATTGTPFNQGMSRSDVEWLGEQYPVSDSPEVAEPGLIESSGPNVLLGGDGKNAHEFGYLNGVFTILLTGVGWREWNVFVDGRIVYQGDNFRDQSVSSDLINMNVNGEVRLEVTHHDPGQRTGVLLWQGNLYGDQS